MARAVRYLLAAVAAVLLLSGCSVVDEVGSWFSSNGKKSNLRGVRIPVMSLDIVELIAGGGCNPLSKKLHALFTAYHPYLATLNLFLEGPAPLPATINPAISANGEAESPGGGQLIDISGLKPCAYILWGSPPH